MTFLKKRKLRVDILTIFITLFAATVFLIVYYSQYYSSKAILEIGNHFIQRTNQDIIDDLDKFLRPAPLVNISSFLLKDKLLEQNEMQSLSSFMHILLDSYPQLTNVYIADLKGNIFIENRISNSAQQVVPFVSKEDIPVGTFYIDEMIYRDLQENKLVINYKTQEGKVLKSQLNPHFSYDPRLRPWFVGAETNKSGKPWIGTYKLYGTQKEGLTISFPLFANKELVGVIAGDLNIKLIENELKRNAIHDKEFVFIINQHGQVISYQHPSLKDAEGTIFTFATINQPVLKAAYQIYEKTKKTKFEFKHANTNYIAIIQPYGLSSAEQWSIATILPTDVFVSELKAANRKSLLFSLFVLLLGILLVIYASHKISRPIMELAKETKEINQFRFDTKSKIKTHIYEVQVMIDALIAAKSALSSFVKYVPKTLVEQMMQSRIIAEVGGRKEKMTVLFTDVENFTQLSENMDPELLMVHFSKYLDAVTRSIQKNQGNIDKYIGDAVMAFWGSPLPDPDHTIHACQAVLHCQRKITKLNQEWEETGKTPFPTRFGLHTGPVIVGNMGSADRLNYTVIGDTVNLAARLETLNKIYGTQIIVSQDVFDVCKDFFLFRPIDVVTVKGKKKSITIYELMAAIEGELEYAPTQAQLTLCKLFWDAYGLYYDKDYEKACLLFQDINERFPEDKLSKIYIKRCKEVC